MQIKIEDADNGYIVTQTSEAGDDSISVYTDEDTLIEALKSIFNVLDD